MRNRNILYYPLSFVLTYITVTLSISLLGPIKYQAYNHAEIIFFIVFVLLFFASGYGLGLKLPIPTAQRIATNRIGSRISKLFKTCFRLSIIAMIVLIIRAAMAGTLSLDLTASGTAYIESYEGYVRNSGVYSIDFIIATLAGFPIFLSIVWGLYYFRTFNRQNKFWLLFIIASIVVVYAISGGKQKQLGDILIYFVTLVFIGAAVKGNVSVKSTVKIACIGLIGIVLLSVILTYRYSAAGVDINNLNAVSHPLTYFDNNHVVSRYLGDRTAFAIGMLSGYLGQGYYGLSLALEQQFTWTYFGGSSYSFSVILNRFFGLPFLVEDSYPYLVGYATGWGQTKWHTIFAWLASDLTFPGTVVFAGIVGFIYARLWKEIVIARNPYSILLFCLLTVGAYYVPANNQLMHSPGGLATLALTTFLYYRNRKSCNTHYLTKKQEIQILW